MSKRLEALAGLSTLGIAVVSGLVYGVAEAKGPSVPGKEYILPLLGISGFCLGARPSCPKDTIDVKVGGVYAGATSALWGVCYGLGYLAEKITS